MTPFLVLLLAFAIGVATGLRSMTPPAIVAWAAHRSWITLHNTVLSFIGATATVALFSLLAAGELVADKLPSMPSRTRPPVLIARLVLGGLSGAAVALAGAQSLAVGAILGAIGGIAGAFGGYLSRKHLVRALKVPDFIFAVLEDVVAIGGSLLIVLQS